MIIDVKVHPGSSKEEVRILAEGQYEIWIKDRAEKGKANNSLIEILAKRFKVDRKDIKVLGLKSRRKKVEINS